MYGVTLHHFHIRSRGVGVGQEGGRREIYKRFQTLIIINIDCRKVVRFSFICFIVCAQGVH